MEDRDKFEIEEDQYLLSPELIQLMNWIIQYEDEALKHIIARAVAQGLKQNKHEVLSSSIEDMQQTFIQFINITELLLNEVISERALKNALQHNLLPALDQIDTSACDDSVIRSSLAVTTSKIERNPTVNAKELLLKELLKRWNPENKQIKH